VVAEGVETAGEAAALRTLGVDFGQGWHFGRPGAPEDLTEVAATRVPAPRPARDPAPVLTP
jgi:EAL domain-containing protein (putative c-di-GMP-specific phosphodiesterase class I)